MKFGRASRWENIDVSDRPVEILVSRVTEIPDIIFSKIPLATGLRASLVSHDSTPQTGL